MASGELVKFIREQFHERNKISAAYLPRHSQPLAEVCQQMSRRFLDGGRLLAFGSGPYLTDAQHVSVEFVHPVIVGKGRWRGARHFGSARALAHRAGPPGRHRDGVRAAKRRSATRSAR